MAERLGGSVGSRFRFGRFELRADERVLLAGAQAQRLGGRAFDILLALVERREHVVEFDELLDQVWPGLAVEENNLSVQISALRKLVGNQAITTVRGRGYQFTAPVTEITHAQHAAVAGGLPAERLTLPTFAREQGVVLAYLADRGTALGPMPAPIGTGHVVRRSESELLLAFPRVREGVHFALQAQRQFHGASSAIVAGRFGIANVPIDRDAEQPLAQACERALALAASAASNEIIVAADALTELVAGVDADLEDLGEIARPARSERAYRLSPPSEIGKPFMPIDLGAGDVKPRVAVLPFECLLGTDADDLLGEALADDAIACFSRNHHITVVSGLSSRRLKRSGLSFSNLAGCLAAHYVLTGSHRHTSSGLLVNVLVQEVRRGVVLHSFSVTAANLKEAFEPLDSIGLRIAREVGRSMLKHAVDRARTTPMPELEGYALLLAAIGLMHGAVVRDSDRARSMLDALLQRPGSSGIAAAWLAKWHVLRVVQGWSTDPAADAQHALDAVKRSLDDGARDPLALAIGGLVHAYLLKDLSTAGWMYEEALDINPSEPLAWLFSATRHAYLGQGQEAEQAGERALSLSPLDPLKYFLDSLAATAMLAGGNWARSLELSRQSLRANRSHASSWRTMTYALVMLDRMDEARDAVQQLQLIDPGFTVGRFRERFPGRDGPMLEPWANALQAAGLPA